MGNVVAVVVASPENAKMVEGEIQPYARFTAVQAAIIDLERVGDGALTGALQEPIQKARDESQGTTILVLVDSKGRVGVVLKGLGVTDIHEIRGSAQEVETGIVELKSGLAGQKADSAARARFESGERRVNVNPNPGHHGAFTPPGDKGGGKAGGGGGRIGGGGGGGRG